jgi:ATP synthase F1 gamma subunit
LKDLAGIYSRNAMDNASKNAGDMSGALQLQYNRSRQAAITNELVDINTGVFSSTHRALTLLLMSS